MTTESKAAPCASLRAEAESLARENEKLRIAARDAGAGRTASQSLGFLAKIARDLGHRSRSNESKQEFLGRLLREYLPDAR